MQIINHYEILLIPLRRPFITIQKKTSAGEDVEKWNFFCLIGRNINQCHIAKRGLWFLKIKNRTTTCFNIPTVDISLKEMKSVL